MEKLQVKARAKINLTLDVLGKRPDGYHEVEMVMQTIELHDTVSLEPANEGIVVTTDHPLLSGGESNIAYRAAKLVIEAYGVKQGVKIDIQKNIPVAAGLAGGSTDAAAVLTGLNKMWGLGLALEELSELGAKIGSDVPFCIKGGTALATGRGEILTQLPDVPEMWLILVKPPLEVSTAEVYRSFDPVRVECRPNTQAAIKAIQNHDTTEIAENLANVLETVTLMKYPQVGEVKQALKEAGLAAVLMSGSGPSIFGIARDRTDAERVAGLLTAQLPGMFVKVTRTWAIGGQEFAGKE